MKKILFGAAGVAAVAIAALLVVPGLIDWNQYKAEIVSQIRNATGRDVAIGGDLKIQVLPAPALTAHDVRIANLKGAAVSDMAVLRQLQVSVALAPLLGGSVQVESVRLVDPVVELEVLADGRRNWDFGPAAPEPAAAPAGGKTSPASDSVRLDSLAIVNGTIVYRDRRSGTVEQVEGINADLSARALSGPFEGKGRLIYAGLPLSFRADVGRMEPGKPASVGVSLGVEGLDLLAVLGGTVSGLPAEPRFQGKLKVEGSGGAVAALAGMGGTVPGFMAQSLALEGDVTGDASGGSVKNLSARLGDTGAEGMLTLSLKGAPAVAVELKSRKVDLDRWLAMAPAPVPAFSRTQGVRVSTSDEGRKLTAIPGSGAPAAEKAKGEGKGESKGKSAGKKDAAALPEGIGFSLAFGVDSIVYKGGLAGQGRLNAELANGEITISQLSVALPGVTNVAAFGFLRPEGPTFEGDLEATSSDVRGLLGWLGVKDIGIPAERLRSVRLASKVRATAEEIALSRLAVEFDGSRVAGGVTLALRARPAFGANLSLDTINLDHYLAPAAGGAKAASGAKAAAKPGAASAPGDAIGAGVKAAAFLDTFDANLKASIGVLTHRGVRLSGISFDGTLISGGLDFRGIGIDDIAGARVRAAGVLRGLGGLPEMENFSFEASTRDPSRLFALAGMSPPPVAKTIGAVRLAGKADGSFLRPKIDAALEAAGGVAQLKGALSFIPLTSPFEGRVSLRHGDLARLLSVIGAGYRPAEKIGGLDVAATLKADASVVDISEITGQVGPVSIEGRVSVSTASARPSVRAELRTGVVPVQLFLPAPEGKSRAQAAKAQTRTTLSGAPVAKDKAVAGAGTLSGRWSRDPIDLSFMRAFDANLALQAKSIVFDTYALSDVTLSAVQKDGVLAIEPLAGNFFGGPVSGKARVDASGRQPRMTGSLRLNGMDVAQAVKAVSGQDLATGRMAVDLDVSAAGSAVAGLVSSLDGKGSFSISDMDVKAGGSGTALAGIIGLFSGLEGALSGVLTGKKMDKGLANVTSTFAIKNGLVNLSNLQFHSAMGNGTAAGMVDLPGWLVDVRGKATVPDTVVAQLLTRNVSREPLPFTIRGDLDNPDVSIKTAGLTGGVKKGLGKVLDKTGIGDVLGLPGGKTDAQPQPQPDTKEAPQQIKPEDVFKSILKGVIKPQ